MSMRTLNRSFSGGEITPELFGRLDLPKVQEALSLCMNFITLPHGPVINRPGTEYVEEVKNSGVPTRLIPFTYSNTQTFALQLGAGYFRFHSQGGTLQAPIPVAAWSAATAYKTGDLASSGGVTYYCVSGNTNQALSNATYWYALPANGDYEIPNPYAAQDLFDIHYTQSADVLTLTHPNYPPMELRRYGATNWQLARVQFTSKLSPPLWSSYTPTPITHTYVVTCYLLVYGGGGLNFYNETLPSAEFSVSSDLSAPGSRNTLTWSVAPSAIWQGQMLTGSVITVAGYNVYKKIGGQYQYLGAASGASFADDATLVPNPGRLAPAANGFDSSIAGAIGVNTAGSANVTATAYGGTGPTTYDYVVTSLNGTEESLPSVHATCANNLATAGCYNTIVWSPVAGVTRYNIYRLSYGIYGFIGQATVSPYMSGTFSRATTSMTCVITGHGLTNGQSYAFTFSDASFNGSYAITVVDANTFTLTVANAGATAGTVSKFGGPATFVDNNITPNIGQTPPIVDDVCNSAGNYPAAVAYYQQRRLFAGTLNQPQNVWATRSGTEANMGYSIPTRDDNRIAFKIAARDASAIRHIVPLQDLLFMSGSCEWKCSSTSGVLTPSTINVQPQSYIGANNVMPVVVGNAALYAAARGGHIRQINYNWQINGYQTTDSSIFAPHLFDYNTIVDMAYCRGPIPVLWCVSSSGKLLGMTYLPEQQIAAWHQHTTGAADVFESVCTITENNEDMLYCIVNRAINGTWHRFVERLHTRLYNTVADCHFVDCGDTYSGAPATNITGLTWLEGMSVNILADGAVLPPQTVTGGAITLPVAASQVHVGLPLTAQLQTPPAAQAVSDPAFAQGRAKNINKVFLRTYRSSGILAGPDFAHLTPYRQRTTESPGSPPSLVTDEIEIVLNNAWGMSGQVCIQQSDPLPLDIAAMTLEIALGGGI